MANGRLLGVLPWAQSPTIQVIANDHVRALAPGINPGATPGNMCQHACNFSDVFWNMQTFVDLFQDHISHFQTMSGKLPGVKPWQNVYEFFKKKMFFNCLKNQNIKI